ncbi:hypothetical protein O1M63_56375 [Streptomyces mirabilis]|nr:hypothetical protein [Streptomyces mirabilis]
MSRTARTRVPLAALSLASVSALFLAGCSQSSNASRSTGDQAASAAAATGRSPRRSARAT